MKNFMLRVSKADIDYVEEVLQTNKIEIPKSMKKNVLGEIFAKKLLELIRVKNPEIEEKTNGNIAAKQKVSVIINGYKKTSEKHKFSCERKVCFKKMKKRTEMTVIPVELTDFSLEEDTMDITLQLYSYEFSQEEIKHRIPKNSLNGFSKEKEVTYEVLKPSENFINEGLWKDMIMFSQKEMLINSTQERLFCWTLDVLKRRKLTYIGGKDAWDLKKILKNARHHYPIFRSLDEAKQLEIINNAAIKAYSNSKPDVILGIHNLAKAVIVEFMDLNIHNIVRINGINYYKQKEYLHLASYSGIDKIKFVSYQAEINGKVNTQSLKPMHLCMVLIKSDEAF